MRIAGRAAAPRRRAGSEPAAHAGRRGAASPPSASRCTRRRPSCAGSSSDLRDIPRRGRQPARTAAAGACSRAARDGGAPRTSSHSTHGRRSSRAISRSCSMRRELARRGRAHALLPDPVTQHVAPTRRRQARRAAPCRGRRRPRRAARSAAASTSSSRPRFAQVRGRATSRCEPRPASARAAPAARDGAESCDRSSVLSLEGSSSHCSRSPRAHSSSSARANSSSGRTSQPPPKIWTDGIAAEPAQPGAAHQREQHRLQLIVGVMGGQQDFVRLAGSALSAS